MSEFFALALCFAFGYLIGSFPTAYLLVLWKSRIDIRKAGSGNVGALNSYEVTRSRLVGILVLGIDLVKGMIAVWAVSAFAGGNFQYPALSTIGAVSGHNFPVWLKGKGGRGLATAAGAMLLLSWLWVVLWGMVWVIAFIPSRKVNPASAIACAISLAMALLGPGIWLAGLLPPAATIEQFRVFGGLLFLLLLSRLVGPLSGLTRGGVSQVSKQE